MIKPPKIHRIKLTANVYAFLAAAICMTGCNEAATPTGDFINVSETGWAFGENLTFRGPVDSTVVGLTDASHVILAVRHSNDYDYANLWLTLTYHAADDSVVADTVNVGLADEFGKWYGNGTGVSLINYDTIELKYPRRVAGDIHIRHIMRVDTIRGIEQIGLLPVAGNDLSGR